MGPDGRHAVAQTLALFLGANLFMSYAWFGHLKDLKDRPLWIAVLASWLVAGAEYWLRVPANRIGVQQMSLLQLRVLQEILAMAVFGGFVWAYMGVPLTRNYVFASLCLVAAAWFIFQDGPVK